MLPFELNCQKVDVACLPERIFAVYGTPLPPLRQPVLATINVQKEAASCIYRRNAGEPKTDNFSPQIRYRHRYPQQPNLKHQNRQTSATISHLLPCSSSRLPLYAAYISKKPQTRLLASQPPSPLHRLLSAAMSYPPLAPPLTPPSSPISSLRPNSSPSTNAPSRSRILRPHPPLPHNHHPPAPLHLV